MSKRKRELEREREERERMAVRASFRRSLSSVLILIIILFFFTFLMPNVLHIDLAEIGRDKNAFTILRVVTGIALIIAPFAMLGSAIHTYVQQGGTVGEALRNARRNIRSQSGFSLVAMFVVGVAFIVWAIIDHA